METNIPFVGKLYEVIYGPYKGFIGECVSYDMESGLPIILKDKEYNTRAVKENEVVAKRSTKNDISGLQKN